ncbi:MAG: hypothetical protein M3153_11510 [Chloroflexota bacterium]|nr:hypothetical protein [Chloroflexota bacterium]
MKRISILLIALLASVVAACSSGEPSATESASEPVASQQISPEPSQSEAAESEAPGASGSAAALPSFDLNGDPELAARFPDTVGGEPLMVQSFRGDTFEEVGGSDPTFQAFLDSIGAEMSDVSVAFGGAAGADPASVLSVGAFRVLGASEDELEREFIAASEESGDMTGLSPSSLAGKDIWTATDPSGETGSSVFIYTKDDTLYFLTGSEEQVSEILAALP